MRAPLGNSTVETIRASFEGDLATTFGIDAFTIVRTETVGPKIGEELQRNAFLPFCLFCFNASLYRDAV